MGFDFSKAQIQEDDNIAEICIFNYIVEELVNNLFKIANVYYTKINNTIKLYTSITFSKNIEFSDKGVQIKIIVSKHGKHYTSTDIPIIIFISNNYIVNIDSWFDANYIVNNTSVLRPDCFYSFLKILKENKLFASIKHIQYPENSIYDFHSDIHTWDYNFLKLYLTYLYPNNFRIKVKNLTIKNTPKWLRKTDIIKMFMNKNKEQERQVFNNINRTKIKLSYENKSI